MMYILLRDVLNNDAISQADKNVIVEDASKMIVQAQRAKRAKK
jgi:hypothetical protein